MLDAIDVLHALNNQAAQLDASAAELERVEDALRPVTLEYEDFMGAFEEGLWQAHVAGAKLPSEALRARMAHRAMDPALLGSYTALTSKRRQLKERIAAQKDSLGARRSILSAMKDGLVS